MYICWEGNMRVSIVSTYFIELPENLRKESFFFFNFLSLEEFQFFQMNINIEYRIVLLYEHYSYKNKI